MSDTKTILVELRVPTEFDGTPATDHMAEIELNVCRATNSLKWEPGSLDRFRDLKHESKSFDAE